MTHPTPIIIGIDPGVTGACALLRDPCTDPKRGAIGHPGHISIFDLPILQIGKAKWLDAKAFSDSLEHVLGSYDRLDVLAFVEHLHAFPQMGTVAAFSKGMSLGSVVATLQSHNIAFELVTPLTWKKHFGLLAPKGTPDNERKRMALSAARTRYPAVKLEREKDHNRAEALMIATYGLARWRAGIDTFTRTKPPQVPAIPN